MVWSQTKLRLRSLIIIELVALALMAILVYGTGYASPSDVQTESSSNAWIVLLFFLLAIIGILCQLIGLISLFIEKRWAKYVFLLGVCASAISSLSQKGGMSGNWFLALVALAYWIVAGAIIALSFDKANPETVP
jgi:hypothetical protein